MIREIGQELHYLQYIYSSLVMAQTLVEVFCMFINVLKIIQIQIKILRDQMRRDQAF